MYVLYEVPSFAMRIYSGSLIIIVTRKMGYYFESKSYIIANMYCTIDTMNFVY